MRTFAEAVNRSARICEQAQESLGHEEDLQRLVAEGCFYRLTSDGKELTITNSMVRVKSRINKRQGSSPDTSRVREGKPGSRARIEAYRAFYARGEGSEESAFTVDLADALASGQERRGARSKYDLTISLRPDRSSGGMD